MLDQALKEQLKSLFLELKSNYTLDLQISPEHAERVQAISLLSDVASCSDKIHFIESAGEGLQLNILKESEHTGIIFRAIPNGHEFTSLLLAILNCDGIGKNLPDEHTVARIKALKGPISLSSYISLSCTNCPDIVQALNIVAFLHPGVTHQAIDGEINQAEVEKLRIQAVPTVYADGELLHVGKSTLGELIEKLEQKYGRTQQIIQETQEFDLIVAGGGPAGVTAAIYSARKGLSVAIVAGKIGGQVNETKGIENISSILETTGPQLASDLRAHAQAYPISIFEERTIESVAKTEAGILLEAKGGERFSAPQLIIATGAQWRKLGLENEQSYIGRGVAFCPHCDGPFYKGKSVAVVGGGNSGVEAAIDLAGICSHVTLVEFADALKADKHLQEKMALLNNVSVHVSSLVKEIVGDEEKVTGIEILSRKDGSTHPIDLSGIFVQIGLTANSQVFKDLVEVNSRGEILVDRNGRTSVEGIYAAGDVTDVTYKQILIAMGEGAKASLAAFEDQMKVL